MHEADDSDVCFNCEITDPEIKLNHRPHFCCPDCAREYDADMPLVKLMWQREQERKRRKGVA